MVFDVMVIGGGASGLAAAVTAGRLGCSVLVLERLNEPGKKILATGNGRCNLTNNNITAEKCISEATLPAYRSGSYVGKTEAGSFAGEVISRFESRDAINFFSSLGILTHSRGEYVYPRSDQAGTVRDALVNACEESGNVRIITGCRAAEVRRSSDGFEAACENGKVYIARKLILATGGRSQPKLGSDGSGEDLAASLGHSTIKSFPALCALRSDDRIFFKTAAGVRAQGRISIFVNGGKASEDSGEIQYTSSGLSGIPVFQVSRFAGKAIAEGKTVAAELDLLPDMTREDILGFLTVSRTEHPGLTAVNVLSGIMNKKLSAAVLYKCGVPYGEEIAGLSKREVHRLVNALKGITFKITGTAGFEDSQVTAGGVSLAEVDPETMMSRIVNGLYITGELLDVDGICGGYNLHFAWATGIMAGQNASENQ